MQSNTLKQDVLYVNNTGANIDILMPLVKDFAMGGKLHEDIADLLDIEIVWYDSQKRVIINWLED